MGRKTLPGFRGWMRNGRRTNPSRAELHMLIIYPNGMIRRPTTPDPLAFFFGNTCQISDTLRVAPPGGATLTPGGSSHIYHIWSQIYN